MTASGHLPPRLAESGPRRCNRGSSNHEKKKTIGLYLSAEPYSRLFSRVNSERH